MGREVKVPRCLVPTRLLAECEGKIFALIFGFRLSLLGAAEGDLGNNAGNVATDTAFCRGVPGFGEGDSLVVKVGPHHRPKVDLIVASIISVTRNCRAL